MSRIKTIGVIGAGTMGSGIAQVGIESGFSVIMYDVDPAGLAAGAERIKGFIERGVEKGRMERSRADGALALLRTTGAFDDLSEADIVIEAAPEDMALKQDLFRRLADICRRDAILATNTSSLSVTAIAGAVAGPGRVAGMHFFNPAPLMPLVEVISGHATDPATARAVEQLAREMGKTPVAAKDTPGFIVNRVARPFYGEALRILGESIAPVPVIDRLVREAGFPMGPFQLMDLIGIDVNFAVTKSVYEATFGEPRYRPHLIQARMVAAGRLGRKTGRGFYDYGENGGSAAAGSREAGGGTSAAGAVPGSGPGEPPGPASGQKARGRVLIVGDGAPAAQLAARCQQAGWDAELLWLTTPGSLEAETGPNWERLGVGAGSRPGLRSSFPGGAGPEAYDVVIEASTLVGDARRGVLGRLDAGVRQDALFIVGCYTDSAASARRTIGSHRPLVGFAVTPPLDGCPVAELAVPAGGVKGSALFQAEQFFSGINLKPVTVGDGVGLVLPRLAAALANEAVFAVGEGAASPADVDRAMALGTNYPRGPLEWAAAMGLPHLLAVMEGLWLEFREDRYRPAPLLRRLVEAGRKEVTRLD